MWPRGRKRRSWRTIPIWPRRRSTLCPRWSVSFSASIPTATTTGISAGPRLCLSLIRAVWTCPRISSATTGTLPLLRWVTSAVPTMTTCSCGVPTTTWSIPPTPLSAWLIRKWTTPNSSISVARVSLTVHGATPTWLRCTSSHTLRILRLPPCPWFSTPTSRKQVRTVAPAPPARKFTLR